MPGPDDAPESHRPERHYAAEPSSDAASGAAPPIRVLLWSARGSGLHYGGPGSSAYRLYRRAREATPGRFRVTLAHGFGPQADAPPNERATDPGVYADEVFVGRYEVGALSQYRFLRDARRWIADHAGEFDVFHGVQGFDHTARPAARAERAGVPAVVKLAAHRIDLADKPGLKSVLALPRRRRQLFINTISGVICISRSIEQEVREYGIPEGKIVYLPDSVDVERFRPPPTPSDKPALRAALGWPDRPTVAFVGGMVRRKRPHLLIEAVARLARRGVEAQVALIGPEHEADYVAQMRSTAADLAVTDRVVWAGFHADVAPHYRACDCYALPSSSEGLPNATLEAMASGLAAVCTPISGAVDVIDDGANGRLVGPDPDAIADALSPYLDDPAVAEAQGAAARRTILDRYSTDAILDAHEALFRRVMAGQPAAD